MVRKHTPAELEQAHRILAENKPNMEKMVAGINQEKIDASETIAMLERRTKEQTIDIPLEGGDTIRIFSRMSEADLKSLDAIEEVRNDYVQRAGEIMDQLKMVTSTPNEKSSPDNVPKLKKEMDSVLGLAADCWLRVIAKITVDPAISYEWLKQNPDRYSPEDIVDAYLAYKEARKIQISERVNRVRSFRANFPRAGIYPTPALDGDHKP
ncbi:MAG: hypothetical protein WCX48_08065 [Bacteroidales bacterium]